MKTQVIRSNVDTFYLFTEQNGLGKPDRNDIFL